LGCDHSTNSQDPPAGSEFTIESPRTQTVVEGSVTISIRAAGLVPTRVEFYVDGNLIGTSTERPWQYVWNASALPSNSYHTIKARAFNSSNSYKISPEVIVQVK
jgi:hypothetical protein